MGNSEDRKSTVEGTIKAVSDLVDKVPVYEDAVRPFAQETGKAFGTLGRAVNAALSPIKGLVWGIERIEVFLNEKLTKKLENIEPEKIITPDPSVAGPTIESLRFSGHNESLADMYATLLATSMIAGESFKAHPSFVEIIRQLTSDEAKILSYIYKNCDLPEIHHAVISVGRDDFVFEELREKFFEICTEASLERLDLMPTYLDNLRRLQVIEFDQKHEYEIASRPEYMNDSIYRDLGGHTRHDDIETRRFEFLKVSEFGLQFMRACLPS